MVAMSGAIMPEPLQKPLIVMGTPSILAFRVAPLGKVSVVMMARAPSDQPSAETAAIAPGRPARILSAGGGSPITPVEEMKTSLSEHFSSLAVARAVAVTTLRPALPV